uniref:Putative secreted protein n=1 Tax=Ixodes ricinus TaxID=34613 RepID=A0A6B0UA29_IXORI
MMAFITLFKFPSLPHCTLSLVMMVCNYIFIQHSVQLEQSCLQFLTVGLLTWSRWDLIEHSVRFEEIGLQSLAMGLPAWCSWDLQNK